MTQPTDADLEPVGYATRDAVRPRVAFLLQSWLACAAAMPFCGLAALFILADRQRFAQVFADFHLKLPTVAQVVINVPGWVIAAAGAATAVGLLVVQINCRSKHAAAVVHVLAIAGWCLTVLIYRQIMWDVMLSLMTGMTSSGTSGGRPGSTWP